LTEINIGQRPAGTLGSGPVIKETTMRTALILAGALALASMMGQEMMGAEKLDADKIAGQQQKVDELRRQMLKSRERAPGWMMDGNE
jgi:hypothetical protein